MTSIHPFLTAHFAEMCVSFTHDCNYSQCLYGSCTNMLDWPTDVHMPCGVQVISRMFKVTFGSGETVLEQDSLPTDDDCLYMLDSGEVDIVIAGSGEAANTNQEERKVSLPTLVLTPLPLTVCAFPVLEDLLLCAFAHTHLRVSVVPKEAVCTSHDTDCGLHCHVQKL